MTNRLNALETWLHHTVGIASPHLVPLTNDASFRRYFRVWIDDVPHVVMDAPPEKENCKPFIEVTNRLLSSGLNAPKVIASCLNQGFLLLSDLGSDLYLPALQAGDSTQVDQLYRDALQALFIMQTQTASDGLPLYDRQLLHTEMHLFTDWLLERHLHLSLSEKEHRTIESIFEQLSASALAQPQVFVHRDYHSRNLMVLANHNPGILDFQDAVKGAITYDLVSLLRDCYVAWPVAQVVGWVEQYYQMMHSTPILHSVDFEQFLRWFDWMGVQRHLKASGIFARLYRRDHKEGYLKDIPRTLNYIVGVGVHYPELQFLAELIDTRVLPACHTKNTELSVCA